jgi:hypothetical protein
MEGKSMIFYDIDNNIINKERFTTYNSVYVIWSFASFNVSISLEEGGEAGKVAGVYHGSGGVAAVLGSGTSTKCATIVFYEEFVRVIVTLTGTFGGSVFQQILYINYRDTNIIEQERQNLHYKDILINKHLPPAKELVDATFTKSEFLTTETHDIVKKLLIDYYKILSRRGSKKGIEYFFNLVGLKDVEVMSEFLKDNGSLTLQPDTLKDIKTGNYHVLYYNFELKGWDRYNLPIRWFIYDDIERFKSNLIEAIVLANEYFTSIEQEIVFFGIVASANAPRELSIASLTTERHYYDVMHFRRELNINLIHYQTCPSVDDLMVDIEDKPSDRPSYRDSVLRRHIIYDSAQMEGVTVPRTEVKFLVWNNAVVVNESLMEVYDEVVDKEYVSHPDTLPDEDTHPLLRKFGTVLHLTIESPKTEPHTYIDARITNMEDLTSINVPVRKVNGGDKIYLQFYTSKAVKFMLEVSCLSLYGAKESYKYEFEVVDEKTFIDFNTYSSFNIDPYVINDLTLDIDSPSRISGITDNGVTIYNPNDNKNYTLHIPAGYSTFDLRQYFKNDLMLTHPFSVIEWWQIKGSKYRLPNMNKYYPIDDCSSSIPVYFMEAWVDIVSFRYDPSKTLKLKIYDYQTSHKTINIDFWKLAEYGYAEIDKLYITLVDIVTNWDDIKGLPDTLKPTYAQRVPYIFVSTTECGINLAKGLYDLVLTHKVGSVDVEESIYELGIYPELDYKHQMVPVNYDYPLIVKEHYPNFHHHIGMAAFYMDVEKTDGSGTVRVGLVRSIFPVLCRNVRTSKTDFDERLKINDVIVCKINPELVSDYLNIKWQLYDAFSGEYYHESYDEVMKYRIKENTVYSITVEFTIYNKVYTISKNSAFTSFKRTTNII